MAVYGGAGTGSPGYNAAGRVRFEAIGEAFEELKRNFGTWVVSALIVWAVIVGISLVFGVATGMMDALSGSGGGPFMGRGQSAGLRGALMGGSIVLKVAQQILISIVSMFMTAGQYNIALKAVRGLPVQVGDMFTVFDRAVPLIVAGLLVGILQGIGFVCCCFPALIVAAIFMFTVPLIVDRNTGAVDAMTASFEAWKRDPVMATLFLIVIGLCSVIGFIACCIGVILTQPLMPIGIAIVYRDMFESPAASAPGSDYVPPTTPIVEAPAPEPPAAPVEPDGSDDPASSNPTV